MGHKVIRKLDNYNFTISEELDEPVVKEIAGNKVTYEYKNFNLYYGRLYEAIRGLARHTNNEYVPIPKSFNQIRPSDDESVFEDWVKIPYKEIVKKLAKLK